MSFQAAVENHTPFVAEKYILPDKDGQETVLIVVAATFQADSRGSLHLAAEQLPIQEKDEPWGDPASSSIRRENDLALEKPLVDVIVNAHAYAPKGQPASSVTVKLEIGDIRKELIVSGDRRWNPLLGPSSADPFDKMPIIWERAFGGMDTQSLSPAADLRNWIGIGLGSAKPANPDIKTEIPNVEYSNSRMSLIAHRIEPAGFGTIARGWKPRIGYAGTYDAAWQAKRWPLLPVDFNPLHNQAAPVDQQSKTIQGGEEVELRNLTPNGIWNFRLPKLNIPVQLLYDDRRAKISLRMDTVLIEPDFMRVVLVSRAAVRTVRNRGMLREILLGHMTPAYQRAKALRKEFLPRKKSPGIPGTDTTTLAYYL